MVWRFSNLSIYHNHLDGCWNRLLGPPWLMNRKQYCWSPKISKIAGSVSAWFESAFPTSVGDIDSVVQSLTLWEPLAKVIGTPRSPVSSSLPHQSPIGGRELWGEAHEDTGEAESIADHFGHFLRCQVSQAHLYFKWRLEAPSFLCLFIHSCHFIDK